MTSPVGQPSPAEAFLMEVELANPGATGREDLIAQYFPDGTAPQPPQTAEVAILAEEVRLDLSTEGVTNVPQVGEATQERLAGAGIRTAGELANASVNDLAGVGIGERRANFLISQAQTYVGVPPAPASSDETVVVQGNTLSGGDAVSADRIAAANDAVNNDDAVRLANGVGVAVRNALSGGGIPTLAQTAQITAQAGLPDVPQATQFVQVTSAMDLSGQQAQTVVQDVQQHNALGADIAGAIRSSLSTLTLSNGSQLDSGRRSLRLSNSGLGL